ncbi:MinD/ParA family protein [uncultured Clostridium sp.]|uniref:MinD/ParA family protein n=1 Tax=uncultured Clostridium sp. TaxID=59620 RepID=UPI0025D3703B|nr:MinD/ParA family protein [uncultured Clostridium sp.]
MLDQAEKLRRLASGEHKEFKKKANIITVTSGKGGVGKSNFVVNLGIKLQQKGKRVVIFDADIGMGNDDVLMGVYPKYTVFDCLRGKSIKDILVEGPAGVKLLPGGSGLNQVEELQDQERELFLEKLKELDEFDYILMDTGAGISRTILGFIACSEELVIITTPEPTSLTDAYSLMKATDHFNIKENAKIIINRAFNIEEGEETFQKFQKAINKFLFMKVEYLGCILEDRNLVKSVRSQVPVVLSSPNSDSAICIEKIANTLLGRKNNNVLGAHGLFKKLFNLFS